MNKKIKFLKLLKIGLSTFLSEQELALNQENMGLNTYSQIFSLPE